MSKTSSAITYTSYFTKAELRSRGWTDANVDEAFPEPTTWVRPSKNACRMRLYSQSQAEVYERTHHIGKYAPPVGLEEEATTNIISKKEEWDVQIVVMDMKTLREDAMSAHEKRKKTTSGYGLLYETNEEKIMVNHVRHKLTNYDSILSLLNDKKGISEAKRERLYFELRDKVLDLIAKEYPLLAWECEMQKSVDVIS